MSEMDLEAVQRVLDQVESPYTVDEVREEGGVRLRLPVAHAHIRPGGTISGPALMAIADGARVGGCLLTGDLTCHQFRRASILTSCTNPSWMI